MEKRESVVMVPNGDFRHVKAKNGKDWYVQRAGLLAEDGLTEAYELWHMKQDQVLKPGRYSIGADGAYVSDGRLVVRPFYLPLPPAK